MLKEVVVLDLTEPMKMLRSEESGAAKLIMWKY
jgi:hypothetical protein